jgi:acyl carrier protein
LGGYKYLCAYVVFAIVDGTKAGGRRPPKAPELTVEELRAYLGNLLPDYMIPSFFVQLSKIPLTSNGKVDRSKLPEPEGNIRTGVLYEAPRNETEQTLVNIWQEVLGADKVGIDDNFFDLGGHSLKAVNIAQRAKNENIDITIMDIFKYRTIRKMLENSARTQENVSPGLATQESSREFPGNHEGTRIILKYKFQRDYTSFLFRALPLGIIYAHEQMLPWLYQHFIQICAQTGDDGRIVVDYGETMDAHREVINHVKIGYADLVEVTDIVSYLKERINLNQYVIICLDEFYLGEKANYQKNHFVHESMIYGYDSSKQQFIGCGYNREQILDRLIFSYDEVSKAYEAGKTHYKGTAGYAKYQAVQLLSVIEREAAIEFDLRVFCKELNSYLLSIGEKERDCIMVRLKDRSDSIPRDRIKHGLNAYVDIIHALEQIIRGKYLIEYRSFHLIAEHKKGMYERLGYITGKFPVNQETVQAIEDYREVIDLMERVRLKVFEAIHADQNYGNDASKVIKQIINDLKLAREKEQELLSKILEQLRRSFHG